MRIWKCEAKGIWSIYDDALYIGVIKERDHMTGIFYSLSSKVIYNNSKYSQCLEDGTELYKTLMSAKMDFKRGSKMIEKRIWTLSED